MTHVIHVCKNTPDGLLESLAASHGWDAKGIPLNKERHANCPYCGESTDKMDIQKTEDTIKLQRNLKAKGTSGPSGGMTKGDYSEVMKELKSLRAAVDAKKGGKD